MSETNNLRALLMAALMVMSVFAGVGTVSALEGDVAADDVAVGQDTATQEVTYNTTISGDDSETVTLSGNNLNNVDILAVGASVNSVDGSTAENLSVTESSVDDGTISVTVENNGTTDNTGMVTLTVVHDTSDADLGNVGSGPSYDVSNGTESASAPGIGFNLTTNEVSNNGLVFQGGVIHVNVSNLNQNNVALREVTDSSENETSFVSQVNPDTVDADNWVEIDTSDLEGDYIIMDDTGFSNGIQFEVATQSISTQWDDSSVTQGDENTLELDSSRSNYIVEVSADGLDAEDLETIFGDSPYFIAANEEDDSVYLEGSNNRDITANFPDTIDANNYEFNVEVTDTTANDTASIEVSESDADVNFGQSVYTDQVGDEVEMSVNMQDRDEAIVFVGGDDVNYLEAVRLTDDDDDGVVNFTFNTYLASDDTNPFALTEESDDDELEHVTSDIVEEDGNDGDIPSNTLGERIEPGDYDLRTSTSLEYNANDDEVVDEQDVATLDLTERSTDGISTLTASSGNADEYDDVEELLQNTNQSSTLAINDRLVVQVNASGVSGIVDEGDFSSLSQDGINFSIEEADSGANAQSNPLGITGDNAEIYSDQSAAEDQFFVVIDTRNVNGFEDDEEYEATFTVGDEDSGTSPIDYVDDEEEESVSTTFTAEEADAELNLNDDDQFEVAQSQNAQVEFDTNLAGGSEVSVRLRSSQSGSSFLLSNTAETDGNGTVSTTFDTSDVDVGTEFNVIVRKGSSELANEDGIIVEGTNQTGTAGTVTDTGTVGTGTDVTETVTDTETETDTGVTTTGDDTPTEGGATTTDGGTPGFGVIVAVTALLAAALLAVRRD